MEVFLNQMGLSEEATNLYLQSLGKNSLTFSEIYTMLPNIDLETFNKILEELKSSGLIIQVQPQKPGILMHYLPIPPISLILTYYSNIKTGLPGIIDQVKIVLANKLTQMFQAEDDDSGANVLISQFHEIKNDFEEDSMIQKQDLEDIIDEIKMFNDIKIKFIKLQDILTDFQKKLKSITQTQFAGLIQILTKIKTDISTQITELGLKKNEAPVLNIIEETFKVQLQTLVDEFSSNLNDLIEEELKNASTPIKENIEGPIVEIIENTQNLQDELKTLGTNLFNNFESKMERIYQLVGDLSKIQDQIIENVNDVIQGSMEQVSSLNNPIENTLENCIKVINASDALKVENLWLINSEVKLKEEILSIFLNSKNQINMIVPKLETFIDNQQLQNLSAGLNAKIASSDHETNSLVKSLTAIKTVNFKHLDNQNIVAASGDNSRLVMGIVRLESKDPLKNFIGIGTDNQILINILRPIIDTTLGAVAPSAASTPVAAAPKPKTMLTPTPRPSIVPPPIPQIPPPSQEIPGRKPSQGIQSSIQPQAGDKVGSMINAAFNAVLQQLDTFKGSQFGKALQEVTDVVLENKGYSVTLHNIRTWVNNYKMNEDLLTEQDKIDIREAIENWKQRLI
jgi:hypothetical protein